MLNNSGENVGFHIMLIHDKLVCNFCESYDVGPMK